MEQGEGAQQHRLTIDARDGDVSVRKLEYLEHELGEPCKVYSTRARGESSTSPYIASTAPATRCLYARLCKLNLE